MSRFSSSGVKRNNERISNCTAAAVSRSLEIGSTAFRNVITKKNCCSFGFCPNEGGGGAAQIFVGTFSQTIF